MMKSLSVDRNPSITKQLEKTKSPGAGPKESQVNFAFLSVLKNAQQKLHTHHYAYSTHKEWNQRGTKDSDNAYTQDLLNPDITPNGLTRNNGVGSCSTDIQSTEFVETAGGSIDRIDHLTGGTEHHTLIANLNWKVSHSNSHTGQAYSRQTSRYGIETVWYKSSMNVPAGYVHGFADQWLNQNLVKANSLAKK